MSNLFVRPSEIIDRLRTTRDLLTAASGDPNYPAFKVYGAGHQNYYEESAKHDYPISLYVMAGTSTGSVENYNGVVPTNVIHTITIGLIARTTDELAQREDELSVFMKEFLILSLHGFEPINGQTPLTFASENPVVVQGHATYIRLYTFQQLVYVEREDLDKVMGSWDDLDDFLELVTDWNASAPDNDDTAEFTTTATVPGP